MLTLIPDRFVLEEVTTNDFIIAALAWGFSLGIGWLTTWSAMLQTRDIHKRHGLAVFYNVYAILIWGEILVCLSFSIICFMYLLGVIVPSFAFYFCILTLWALQVQFLLQIIINRCGILMTDKRRLWRLKMGVAAAITAINISVYCIWIPARLQINDTYVHVNEWWDRAEKIIYLLVDAALNFYFIRIVQKNLVELGLHKYKRLVWFNMSIIGFSLGMDVLIIAMMSLKNTFVYMQFHPLAYIVKLNIEMSMADLIAKIARSQDRKGNSSNYGVFSQSTTRGGMRTVVDANGNTEHPPPLVDDDIKGQGKAWATVTTTLEMHAMDASPKNNNNPRTGFPGSDTDSLIEPAANYLEQGEDRRDKSSSSISSYN